MVAGQLTTTAMVTSVEDWLTGDVICEVHLHESDKRLRDDYDGGTFRSKHRDVKFVGVPAVVADLFDGIAGTGDAPGGFYGTIEELRETVDALLALGEDAAVEHAAEARAEREAEDAKLNAAYDRDVG